MPFLKAWMCATASRTTIRHVGTAPPAKTCWWIRRNHQTGAVSLDPLRWGLIPYWCEEPKGGRKPINAKCETVGKLPTFRDAYRRRRCIVPVDGKPGPCWTGRVWSRDLSHRVHT